MKGELPESVIPLRAGQQSLDVEGELPAARCERLTSLYSLVGPIAVQLGFRLEEPGLVLVSGHLTTRIRGQCQRCLSDYESELSTRVAVRFCAQTAQLAEPAMDERLEGAGEPLNLAAFVEDELLLGAPMVTLHPAGQCVSPGKPLPVPAGETQGKRRPFGDLGKLLKGSDPTV